MKIIGIQVLIREMDLGLHSKTALEFGTGFEFGRGQPKPDSTH